MSLGLGGKFHRIDRQIYRSSWCMGKLDPWATGREKTDHTAGTRDEDAHF